MTASGASGYTGACTWTSAPMIDRVRGGLNPQQSKFAMQSLAPLLLRVSAGSSLIVATGSGGRILNELHQLEVAIIYLVRYAHMAQQIIRNQAHYRPALNVHR